MKQNILAQIALLRAGKPLEAFDRFFSPDGLMFANDTLFATGRRQGHDKQAPFIEAATSIIGRIEDVHIDEAANVCVFRNLSTFTTAPALVPANGTGTQTGNDTAHAVNGVCWQQWADGQICLERYFDGELMQQLVADGILTSPAILLQRPLPS